MSDLFSQLDSSFILLVFAGAINLLTEVGKRYHKSPLQVFTFISFIVCFVYALLVFSVGHEAVHGIILQIFQIVLIASGAWHVLMRKDGVLQCFIKKLKKASK